MKTKFNSCILAFILLPASTIVNAATTYTVGASGTYTTIAQAYAACNGSRDYVIEIQSDYTTETLPVSLTQLPNKSLINTVTIRPQAGVSGLTITTAAAAEVFDFNGADFVIIDGRPGGTGSGDFTIENSRTASGNYAIDFVNDATYNLINYCSVKGASTSASGGVIYFGAGSVTGNDNNTISNCSIGKSGANSPANCIYSSGTSGATNSMLTVSGCNIVDFKAGGISIVSNTDTCTITGNSFYQTASFTPANHVMMLYINSGGSHTVTGNYFGGQAPFCGGSAYVLNPSGFHLEGILFDTGVTGGACTVNSNTVQNINHSCSSGMSAYFTGIDLNGSADYTVGSSGNGNIIGAVSGTGSITLNASSTLNRLFAGILLNSSGNNTIAYNSIGSITITGSAISGNNGITLICLDALAGPTVIDNNTIGNTTANNITSSLVAEIFAIKLNCGPLAAVNVTVTNNTIQQINLTDTVVPSMGGTGIFGIASLTGFTSCTCQYNTIRNLTNSGTLVCNGIYIVANNNQIISYNTIHDLTANGIGSLLYGISLSTTGSYTATVNSNYLYNFSSTGGGALFAIDIFSTNVPCTVKSNIIGSTSAGNMMSSFNGENMGIFISTGAAVVCDSNIVQQFNFTNTGSGSFFEGIRCPSGAFTCMYNTIKDIVCAGTSATACSGIKNLINGNHTVSSNTIQNITSANPFTGIQLGSTGTCSVNSNTVNNITSSCNGVSTGISLASAGTFTCTGNTIQQFNLSNAGALTGFLGISVTGGTLICQLNTIKNMSSSGTSAVSYGIKVSSNANHTITGDTIQNITVSTPFTGIAVSSTGTSTVNSNVIGSSSGNNITSSYSGISKGIFLSAAGTFTCNGNTLQQFNLTGAAAAFWGIADSSAAFSGSANMIKNMTCAGTTACYGICVFANGNHSIVNNFIRDLTMNSSFTGIYVGSSGTSTVNSNTIGSSSVNNITSTCNASGSCVGISFASTGTYTCNNNTIQQFNLTNTSAFNASFGGISSASTTGALTCKSNTITDITVAGGYNGSSNGGISATSAATHIIWGNLIRNFNVGGIFTGIMCYGSSTVNSNTIGGSSANNIQSSYNNSGQSAGIWFPSTGTVTADSNTIQQFYFTAAATGFWGIVSSSAGCTFLYNTIKNINAAAATQGSLGIRTQMNATHNISYNTLYNISTGSGFTAFNLSSNGAFTITADNNYIHDVSCAGAFTGITANLPASGSTVSNNTIGGTTAGNIVSAANGTSVGITLTGGTSTVNNNIIQQFNLNNTGTSTLFKGITATSGAMTCNYNNIQNITNAGTGASFGIMISSANNHTVSTDSLSSISMAGAFTGISLTSAGTCTVSSNVIGSTATNNMVGSGNTNYYGMALAGGTYTVSNNVIQQFNLTNTGITSVFKGITATSGAMTCSNNNVRNITNAGLGVNAAGTSYGISIVSTGNHTISTDSLSAISMAGAFTGVLLTSTGTCTINSNVIGSTTAGNMVGSGNTGYYGMSFTTAGNFTCTRNVIQGFNLTGAGTSSVFNGISVTTGTPTLQYDTIENIDMVTTSVAAPSLVGISIASAAAGQVIKQCGVKNLNLLTASANAVVYGIYANCTNSAAQSVNITKCNVSGLKNASSGATAANASFYLASTGSYNLYNNVALVDNGAAGTSPLLTGIYVNSTGTTIAYHNSVKLYGTATAGAQSAACFFKNSGAGTLIVKNNVWQNKRTGGAGAHYAVQIANTGGTNTFDYNYLETAAAPIAYWNGTGATATITNWQSASSASVNEITNAIAMDFMGYSADMPIRNTGTNLSAVVPDDKDGNIRSSAPWMGAWESTHPLPIELVSFTGHSENNQNILTWITASERNNDYFTIERSSDAINFTVLGTKPGAGNSTSVLDYSLTDEAPFQLTYYRLKQTDYDGQFKYSQTIALSVNEPVNTSVSVYPNPNNGTFTVSFGNLTGGYSVEIYNAVGQKVFQTVNTSEEALTNIDLSAYPKGIYFVKTETGTKAYINQMVVQ